jgi:hypothetical protein
MIAMIAPPREPAWVNGPILTSAGRHFNRRYGRIGRRGSGTMLPIVDSYPRGKMGAKHLPHIISGERGEALKRSKTHLGF